MDFLPSDSVLLICAALGLIGLLGLVHSVRRDSILSFLQGELERLKDRERELSLRIDDLSAKINGQIVTITKQAGKIERRQADIEEKLAALAEDGKNIFEIEGEESLKYRVSVLEGLVRASSGKPSDEEVSDRAAVKQADQKQGPKDAAAQEQSGPKAERMALTTILAPVRRALRQDFEVMSSLTLPDTDSFLEALSPSIEANYLRGCFKGGLKAALAAYFDGTSKTALSRDNLLRAFKESYGSSLKQIGNTKSWPDSNSRDLMTVLLVGAQGSGKTTVAYSLGLLARDKGIKFLLADCTPKTGTDSIRLSQLALRAQLPVVSGTSSAKLHSIAYKSVHRAQDEKAQILIIDTPPAFSQKGAISNELLRIAASVAREQASPPPCTLLVVDATRRDTVLEQTKRLLEEGSFSGLCLTRLDKTEQQLAALELAWRLEIPLWYLGYGPTGMEFSLATPEIVSTALFEPPAAEPKIGMDKEPTSGAKSDKQREESSANP